MTGVRDRLEATLARLAARAGEEHVFSNIYAGRARAEADAADARLRAGRPLGPLDGRIVSIKDLFDVAGEPTLAGSVVRRDAPLAGCDAPIVQRLRNAGAVIIGKTHMTEFAFTPVGLNPHYGEPGNAIDPARIPGGSSSGAAVSVAEGTSEIAIGSDTGGSVRIPAALNGLVGFKPTARRIPLEGAFPLAPSLDSVGPLTRTVADAILTDAVMAGEKPIPPEALPVKGLRIALPKDYLLADMEPDVAAHFEASLAALEKAGAIIADLAVDHLIGRLKEATRIGSIAGIEASHIHASTWLADPDANVDIRVKRPLSVRMKVPLEAYHALMETRKTLAREMDERLSGFDMFATPATPIVAPAIASVTHDEEEYDRVESLLLRDTQVANQFDLCSITLPMPGMKLPTGLMLTARNGSDKRLLAAALSVEKILEHDPEKCERFSEKDHA
ncbi:amidase [Brucella inopinata BO1]|uniref:amidase n=1 Tax=Brucella inopinata TaxID=1218315 RepID=UPI0001E164B9|nr:amidase [Brucella inopinata]EFM56154.1 amidase [Brucella inopinata BO1]KEY05091.1 amidase [Brucella suis bv. 4 str. 40]